MAEEVPLTKLDAVNEMLHDIGERVITVIAGSTRADVIRAVATLDAVSRRLLNRGWWFNEEEIRVDIDGSNNYVLPANVANVEVIKGGPTASGLNGRPELVIRGRLLYDRKNENDAFPSAPTVVLKVTRLLEFEDMPSNAREYAYAAASVRNQSRALGSSHVDADLKDQAESAWGNLVSEDEDHENHDSTFSQHFLRLMHNR